jgi:hypothetical protein
LIKKGKDGEKRGKRRGKFKNLYLFLISSLSFEIKINFRTGLVSVGKNET